MVDTEAFGHAKSVAFNHDVGGGDELVADLPAGTAFKVQRKASLVAVNAQEMVPSMSWLLSSPEFPDGPADLPLRKGRVTARIVACFDWLDLADIGAHVTHVLRAHWPSQNF